MIVFTFKQACVQWKEIADVIWKRVFEDGEQEEIDIFDAKVGYGNVHVINYRLYIVPRLFFSEFSGEIS